MAAIALYMAELDDRDREVLEVLAEGRVNPLLIREQTELDKGDVNTVLVRLGRSGYIEQITRGLYEITSKGRAEIGEPETNKVMCNDLERALEDRDWTAVEDAAVRLDCNIDV